MLDTNSKDNGGGAKGTGGTDLVTFLRDCRVNTIDALIMAKEVACFDGGGGVQRCWGWCEQDCRVFQVE